jgi:hypothetical protein
LASGFNVLSWGLSRRRPAAMGPCATRTPIRVKFGQFDRASVTLPWLILNCP